jgi:glycosyltransferase involved in cell wall biosynthesis
VIVDASTNEETKKYVGNLANPRARFEVIYEKQVKGGTSSARNIGTEKCSGDVVIFLDDDVMLGERYIEEILNTYANDRKGRVGGVTGAVLPDKSRGKHLKELSSRLYRTIFLWDSLKNYGRVLRTGMLPTPLPDAHTYVQAFHGYNMSFRRHVFDEFRFDEKLENIYPWAYGEDVDFSYRVGKKYLLLVNPKARLVHGFSQNGNYKHDPRFYFYSSTMLVRNFYYIMCKNFADSFINKIVFSWAFTGLLIGRIVSFLLNPTKRKWLALKGVINGLKLTLLTKTSLGRENDSS